MNATDPKSGKSGLITRVLPLVIIALALTAFFSLDLQHYFSLDVLRTHHSDLRAWVDDSPLLALGIFIAVYAGAVAISFPGATILTVFGGFLFGLWPGAPAVVFAATLGATIVFLAAKSALGDVLNKRASGFIASMERGFHENELSYMFFLRLAPVFPFWAVNIAAGILGVRLRNFVIGTGIGIIPGGLVYASIGNAAGAAFEADMGVSLSGILMKPEVFLPFIALAALSLLPVVIKQFSRRHKDQS